MSSTLWGEMLSQTNSALPCIFLWVIHLNNFSLTLATVCFIIHLYYPDGTSVQSKHLGILLTITHFLHCHNPHHRMGMTSHPYFRTWQPLLHISLHPTILPQALQPCYEPVPCLVHWQPIFLLRRVQSIMPLLLANVLACTIVNGMQTFDFQMSYIPTDMPLIKGWC